MTQVQKAIELLQNDNVIGLPTETVYGLAGKIDSEKALKKIFKIKERPFFDPLIVHVSDIEMAKPLVKSWNNTAEKLATYFWPGPLTMVLKKSDKINDLITSGLESVAIRCPKHPLALEIIQKLNTPLAAPSANKFTKTSPTSKDHVLDEFGKEVYVVDGGNCSVGIESTVIGITNNKIEIYRPGMINKEDLIAVINDPTVQIDYAESPVAPGQLKHHYMPQRPVTLTTKKSENSKIIANWVVPNDPELASRQLYAKLREMDQEPYQEIQIILKEEFKDKDSWQGILNRLMKAKSYDLYFSNETNNG